VEAFFLPAGDGRYESTELTRGPWDAASQHAGPPSALLGRALEQCQPRPDTQVIRVTVEILGPVPIAPLEVSAGVLRPGRKVELLTASLRAGGREVMRAQGWRLRTGDVGIRAGLHAPAPPGPDGLQAAPPFPWTSDVGYHTAMEWRFVDGEFLVPGAATVWMRMRYPLVADETPSPLTRMLIAADSGNGVSAVLDWRRWVFINTDLTVHMHRPPAGEWVCLEAASTIHAHGVGLAASTIFDRQGSVGAGMQSLLVDRRGD
jgi:hypothetical protein